jgi:hypothetical protein
VVKEEYFDGDRKYERLYRERKVAQVPDKRLVLASYGRYYGRKAQEMSTNDPTKAFLDTVTHLVQVSETHVTPTSLDEWFTANQARENASALMDHVFQRLMFLGQRLGKLPPLPSITLLQTVEQTREEQKA